MEIACEAWCSLAIKRARLNLLLARDICERSETYCSLDVRASEARFIIKRIRCTIGIGRYDMPDVATVLYTDSRRHCFSTDTQHCYRYTDTVATNDMTYKLFTSR